MATSPLVSICVPTYNPDLNYLRELVHSINQQTWPHIEIVVSDDQSSNFGEIVEILAVARFPVSIKQASQRLGMAANWNESVNIALGDYVIVTGQDDVISPRGIEALVEAAQTYNADVVYGGQGYIGPQGLPIANPSKAVSRAAVVPKAATSAQPDDVIKLGLLYGNVLGDPCSTLIKRTAFLKFNGFSLEYRHAADLELWLRLASEGVSSVFLDTVVASHRAHGQNATATHVTSGAAQADRLKLHLTYAHRLNSDDDWNRSIARLYTHILFDILRYRLRPESTYPRMRGNLPSRIRGLYCEAAELLRLRKPQVQIGMSAATSNDSRVGGVSK